MIEPPANRKKWIINSARTAYDNPWITVREYQTTAPTGNDALYGVVCFKNLALGVVPIDDEGCTYLVGQERFVYGTYSWELPEGGGKQDVPPLVGIQRELSEEAGLKAQHWLPLFSDLKMSNSVTDERSFGFMAWGLSPDETWQKDASEDLVVRRVPFAEAVRMGVSGEINDAFSLVMLLKADHLLRTGGLPPELMRLMRV